MKSYCYLLLFLLLVTPSFAQTLSGSTLITKLSGEKYCIKTIDSENFYALFSNFDTNHDSLISTFSSYETFHFGNKENLIVKLISEFENYESTIELFDLHTGKVILPQNGEVRVSVVIEKQVIIINNDNKNASIIDINGQTLFTLEEAVLEYSTKGFYNSEYILDDYKEIFYDKQGGVISTSDYIVLQIIDKESMIVRKSDDVTLIIDNNDQTIFRDDCAAELTAGKTHYHDLPYVLTRGLCGEGDDVILLVKNKKGKWRNPIKKINNSYWVNYIQPLDRLWNIEDIVEYYVIADDIGMLLDEKGNIKVELENPELAENITYYGPFIYVYTENDYTHKVYLKNGKSLIVDEGTSSLKLSDEHEVAGYFVFENTINQIAYIYNEKSDKLVSFKREDLQYTSLSELERLFNQQLSDQK